MADKQNYIIFGAILFSGGSIMYHILHLMKKDKKKDEIN
jgi:hypothetical protein